MDDLKIGEINYRESPVSHTPGKGTDLSLDPSADLGLVSGAMGKRDAEIKEIIIRESIEPSTRVRQAVDLARNTVNEIRTKHGLDKLDDSELQWCLMDDDKYKKIAGSINGRRCSLGIAMAGVSITCDAPEIPDHRKASNAFHELLHNGIETEVLSVTRQGNAINVEGSRSGARVKRFTRTSEGEAVVDPRNGELLNELANYVLQGEFERELLQRDEFKDEADLVGDRIKSDKYAKYDVQGVHVNLNDKYLQNDKNSSDAIVTMPTLVQQLVEDLGDVVGDINGIKFNDYLIDIKLDPKRIGEFAEAISAKMGKHFFKQLRHAKVDAGSIAWLLDKIQFERLIKNHRAYGRS